MAQQQDTVAPPTSPVPPSLKPASPPGLQSFQYQIYGTGEPYSGKTVEVGGYLYTTQGGALEGFSYQLVPIGSGNNNLQPAPAPTPGTVPPNSQIETTVTFRRGDNSTYDKPYFLPFSYTGNQGRAGGEVRTGAALHAHLTGKYAGTVMLSHQMGNTFIIVTPEPPIAEGPGFLTPDPFQPPNQKPGKGSDPTQQGGGMTGNNNDGGFIIDDPMQPDPRLNNQGGSNY